MRSGRSAPPSSFARRLPLLNDELERDWGVRLETRTGVNSGQVVAGDPAGGQALVTGDAVNVAARLEQAASAGEILIGDATHALAAGAVEATPVEPLVLKGKSEPVAAWSLVERDRPGGSARAAARCPHARPRSRALRPARGARSGGHGACGPPHDGGRSRRDRQVATGARAARERRPEGGGADWKLPSLWRGSGVPAARRDRARGGGGDRCARRWIEGLLADDDHAATIAEHVLQVAGLAEAVEAGRDTQWAVRRFFEALAAERPLLVVFEDVHWADGPLLDLIEFLLDTAQAPLLFVCLAREEFAEQRPAWLDAGPRSSAVRLERLSDADTVALIDDLDRDGTLSDDQRAQLVARSEGNPLFVEQMLALVGESEDDADTVSIPPTIQALLAARLDRLPIDELSRRSVRLRWSAGVLAGRPSLRSRRSRGEKGARLDVVLATLARASSCWAANEWALDRRGAASPFSARADPRRRL